MVDKLTLIDSAFLIPGEISDSDDTCYNYGGLVMEFRDAWGEGDGERVICCWRLHLPHFQATGRRKYSLEAFRVQLQVNASLSLYLAHQVMWHRFVNTKGGMGKTIPCDLYNEHVNRLIKHIIRNMGSNLTEASLQRAARSVSILHAICQTFDVESGVPYGTNAHSTRSDTQDVAKVVMQSKLLTRTAERRHSAFPWSITQVGYTKV